MNKKQSFYNRYGVEEYYIYNPDTNDLSGWLRQETMLDVIDPIAQAAFSHIQDLQENHGISTRPMVIPPITTSPSPATLVSCSMAVARVIRMYLWVGEARPGICLCPNRCGDSYIIVNQIL